jgi:hypothetical protein
MRIFLSAIIIALWAMTAQAGPVDIVRLKYGGGGDWYNDPDMEASLLREFGVRTGTPVDTAKFSLSAGDDEIFSHPFLFVTGHGEIRFTAREVERLRLFLRAGGFIYADDDYGMDRSFRREIARVLPGAKLAELPPGHPIFDCFYDLRSGLPKIHRHDDGKPQAFGLFIQDRLAVFYTYESNISDGWTAVHNDPPEKREQAFRMGVNILWYALTNP